MIQSIEIKGFRGIREGSLADLTPLVVLVGPNGSGKSTVIEAMLIGASPFTGDAIQQVIRRHAPGGAGPRWLLWKAGEAGAAEITVPVSAPAVRRCRLDLGRNRTGEYTEVSFEITDDGSKRGEASILGGGASGILTPSSRASKYLPLNGLLEVRLVEAYPSAEQRPLYELYTKAVERGRRGEARGIVSEVVPGVTNIELLTEGHQPLLHVVFQDHSVPVTLAGDGVLSLMRLSLELSASGGGVALLEEPEVHQHPAAIRQTAKVILAAVRRNIQVVLTTHSLELIDALLAESTPEDLEKLSLYSLLLHDGVLKSSRLPGPEVDFSRGQIEDDLR